MDVAEISKVANRKRMSQDVDKLREKVSNENKKIIKLKVAQDTAYWDLKEKLRQVETNHDKLQQNMLEVQMQYETVSGQYEDEVRQRAETLNMLAGTREICNVLEEHSERLRATLCRCKADQAALYEAYQRSGELVHEMKTQMLQRDEKNKQAIDNLQKTLKLTTDHHNQLLQYFSEEKARAASELSDLKEKLSVAAEKSNELLIANSEIVTQLEHGKRELEKKEDTISGLHRDIKQLINKFNSQANEMTNNMLKVEKDLKESLAANESLRQALNNQEEFTKTVCEQSNKLQEKLAATEDDQSNSKKIIVELETILEEAKQSYDILKNEATTLAEENEKLKQEIFNKNEEAKQSYEILKNEATALAAKNGELEQEITSKNEVIVNLETELQKLTEQLFALDIEKSAVVSALDKAGVEAKEKVAKVQKLTETSIAMETKIQEIENAMKASRESTEIQINELTTTIKTKEKELESKTSTISQLMNQVTTVSDARSKVETDLQKIKQELVKEKDSAADTEKRLVTKLKLLEVSIKNKDMEISKNLSTILELRSDKERLNKTIQSMQNTIDNVQKELTRPAPARITQPRIEPEQDDNAVMLSFTNKKNQIPASMHTVHGNLLPENNDSLFNFMSDNSIDGAKAIDEAHVNRRRFGEMSRGAGGRLSTVPLNEIKRHRALPPTQGGPRFKQPSNDDDMMSLSQVKAAIQNKPRTFFKTRRQEKNKK